MFTVIGDCVTLSTSPWVALCTSPGSFTSVMVTSGSVTLWPGAPARTPVELPVIVPCGMLTASRNPAVSGLAYEPRLRAFTAIAAPTRCGVPAPLESPTSVQGEGVGAAVGGRAGG